MPILPSTHAGLPLTALKDTDHATQVAHHLNSALAYRRSADALELASRSLNKRVEAALNAMDAISQARDQAQSEAETLRAQADALMLHVLKSQAHAEVSPVAVEFVLASIYTKRWADKAAVLAMRVGDRVALLPEPTNLADPNAIKLMLGGKMVGYLARVDTLAIKERQSQGWILGEFCFLKVKNGGSWDNGRVHVRMENPLMGWVGYNPVESPQRNQARMEAETISKMLPVAKLTRKRPSSL